MTATRPDRIRHLTRYLVSFAAGIAAGAVFALLRTPIPVPPLIGLTGLLSVAAGEIGMRSALEFTARRKTPGDVNGRR